MNIIPRFILQVTGFFGAGGCASGLLLRASLTSVLADARWGARLQLGPLLPPAVRCDGARIQQPRVFLSVLDPRRRKKTREALCVKMKPGWCLCLALLFTSSNPSSQSGEKLRSDTRRGLRHEPAVRSHALQEPGVQRLHAGLLSRPPLRPEDDAPGLDGLSPVRLEMGPGESASARAREGGRSGFRGASHTKDKYPPGGGFPRNGKRHGHQLEHRRHGRRDKMHEKGLGSLMKGVGRLDFNPYTLSPNHDAATPAAVPSPTSRIPVATATNEHPPTLPPAATKPQAGHGRGQGEVSPTLDMAMFDWTDYEDMRPVENWPSTKKKDKRRSKNLSSGNRTVGADVIEPCDHHLDCLSGSCCDLRQHECEAHNRGLNNKCYDDCMCEEGLRCFAKFHRKRRVTRRRGRCVEPETADGDQGDFITV
ncbi:draxin isoform X2 [Electrophorus electricus]|uniref:draxin isoform X2 n=1 Tax=Electrophorus electricus TaxID=8005 RepID=UPI0015D00185|nr:draxin isoform X2 [Electrophorus electricus]